MSPTHSHDHPHDAGPTEEDLLPFMGDLHDPSAPLRALRAGPGSEGPVTLTADAALRQLEDELATEIVADLQLHVDAPLTLERVELILRDAHDLPVDQASSPVDETARGAARVSALFDLPPGVLAHTHHAELLVHWRASVDSPVVHAEGAPPPLPESEARQPWPLSWRVVPLLGRPLALRSTGWSGRMVGQPFLELVLEWAEAPGRLLHAELHTHLVDEAGDPVLSATEPLALSAAGRVLVRPSFTLSEASWSRVRGVRGVIRGEVRGTTSLGSWSLG